MEDQKLRATGRTTRLVDIYVQELFTKGICVVVDHCDMSHRTCAELVIKRTSYFGIKFSFWPILRIKNARRVSKNEEVMGG
jgi:hypothetical protein